MNDGYIDCLLGDDEVNIEYLPINIPYRYQCVSTNRPQYVSIQLLGNHIADCLDGSDELSPNLHWAIFRCEFEIDYACWVFRNTENIKEVQLLFHRYCDSIWDTMDGRDEQNCSHWVCPVTMYQCNGTGQCINRKRLCDGEFDCSNGEDEVNCVNKRTRPHWIVEDQCNGSREFFCITSDYLYDAHTYKPCIDVAKVGDGILDCIGGRDERNVFACSDHEMLGDRFVCDNKTQCINYQSVCNGLKDCADGSDEDICKSTRNKSCASDQFHCTDGSCVDDRCHSPKIGCPQENEHLFWCPNSTLNKNENYRSSKIRRLSNYASFCGLYDPDAASPVETPKSNTSSEKHFNKYNVRLHGYCNRGFYLLVKNGTLPVCFCPPSFYGDQCQFNRRRITVRFRLDRFHLSNIPPVLHILVSLIYNQTMIVDHTTRVVIKKDFALKHNLHLLYSRPKLNGSYSVQFEAYDGLRLLTAWEYSVTPLDFLPVLRVTKILRFPEIYPQYCSVNLCKNNGTCHIINSYKRDRYICLCLRDWTGKNCEHKWQSQKCSLTALTHDGGLCICPQGYMLPGCFVRNTVCELKQPCLTNEICIPHSTTYGIYTCLCTTSYCRQNQVFLTLTGVNFINRYPLVIQLLKYSSGYPRLRPQLLVSSLFHLPVIRTIDTRDIHTKDGSIPEIGLLYTFNRTSSRVLSSMSLLYINCSNTFRNLTVDLDTNPRFCHAIEELSVPTQLLHTYCHTEKSYSCFYTTNYICYCSTINNGSECISYQQRQTSCSHCLNHGFCAQGDLNNQSDFECICPLCVTGDLCQFSLQRFSVSFEWLIEKTQWRKMHLIPPIIFVVIGFVFNSLTTATLSKKKVRSVGVATILLVNSITSQLILILSVIRVVYLQYFLQNSSANATNIVLCKGLPYLMTSMSYFSAWLMALVSVERALMIQLSMKCRFFRKPKTGLMISIIICMVIFGSLYKQLEQYKLVTHPNLKTWCIQEIPTDQQFLFQMLSIAHQFVPFFINVLSAIVIIIIIGRSKATSHHLPQRATVVQQARKRVDLLLGPFVCFISQLPELIMLFLNPCTYDDNQWFSHVALIAYYITFAPQMSLFFMYILPSASYKEHFLAIVRRQK